MTYTDITGHDAKIGGFFDRFQDAAIADQRLLWLFPLIYLVLRGPGLISLDAIFGRIKEEGIAYGSGPRSPDDMEINRRRGGRGCYFRDPEGHMLEIMTA